MQSLNLAHNAGLKGRMLMNQWPALQYLEVQGTNLPAVDFNDPLQLSLPNSLVYLDISNVVTTLRTVFIPTYCNLGVLRAINSSITTFVYSSVLTPFLSELWLDHNPMNAPAVNELISTLSQGGLAVQTLSLSSCGLQLTTDVLGTAVQRMNLHTLNIANNPGLLGGLPAFNGLNGASNSASWPPSLQRLVLRGCTGVSGSLPSAYSAFQIMEIDLTGTSLSGVLPESWANLASLTQLSLHDTYVTCDMVLTASGELFCPLPSWLRKSSTLQQLPAVADTSTFVPGVHCQQLGLTSTALSSVQIDPGYTFLTTCACDAGYFGKVSLWLLWWQLSRLGMGLLLTSWCVLFHAYCLQDGQCIACPIECSCNGDSIQDCFPILIEGWVTGIQQVDGSVEVAGVQPFTLLQLLACPNTLTGASLCNAQGLSWTAFYKYVGIQNNPPAPDSSSTPLDWCYPGHTGRLCAQCSGGQQCSHKCYNCLLRGLAD
jgi:hypothetical protein